MKKILLFLSFIFAFHLANAQVREGVGGYATISAVTLVSGTTYNFTITGFNSNVRPRGQDSYTTLDLAVGCVIWSTDCNKFVIASVSANTGITMVGTMTSIDASQSPPTNGTKIAVFKEITTNNFTTYSLPPAADGNGASLFGISIGMRACIDAHYRRQDSIAFANVSGGGSLTANSVDSTHIKPQSIAASGLSQHAIDSIRNITGVTSTTNLVSNGDFSSGLTGWRQNAGKWVATGGGVNKATNVTYRDSLIQDIALQIDSMYRLEYTINSYVSGGINFNVGGVYGYDVTANGSYVEYFTATKVAGIAIQDLNNTNLIVDNIKLYKVSKETLNYQADLKTNSNVYLGGAIYTEKDNGVYIGNWDNKLQFGIGSWNWQPSQPPVSIGYNAMRNGTGVAIGAEACRDCADLSYSTVVGIGAGRRNISGHATLFGTGAGQNVNSEAAVFGDEAGASATTYPINAHGYYALNLSTTGLSTAMGHEALREATTGDNTGIGYQVGRLTTTGRITAIGTQAGYQNTTGRMIGIGRDAGGNASTSVGANITDTEMIYIGDAAMKANNNVMTNSIAIGHGAKVDKSNQVVIGIPSTVENLLYGKLGLGTSPVTSLTSYAATNGFEGAFLINGTDGSNSTSGLKLQNGSNTLEISQAGASHSGWANTSRWVSPAASAFLTTGSNPIDYYTNSALRMRIAGDGTIRQYGNSIISGTLAVGLTTTALDALHMKGDYFRIEQNSLNGTTVSPTLYGLKFFANGGTGQQAAIEVTNSRQNQFESTVRFSAADESAVMKNVMTLTGKGQNVGINTTAPQYKLDINANTGSTGNPIRLQGLVNTSTADSIIVYRTANAGVLERMSLSKAVQGTAITESTVTGIIGTTVTFTGINLPTDVHLSHIKIWKNGLFQTLGGSDYTISSTSPITLIVTVAAVSGDKFTLRIE